MQNKWDMGHFACGENKCFSICTYSNIGFFITKYELFTVLVSSFCHNCGNSLEKKKQTKKNTICLGIDQFSTSLPFQLLCVQCFVCTCSNIWMVPACSSSSSSWSFTLASMSRSCFFTCTMNKY